MAKRGQSSGRSTGLITSGARGGKGKAARANAGLKSRAKKIASGSGEGARDYASYAVRRSQGQSRSAASGGKVR